MRHERRYIVEWVAWHRFLGFEIWIADHGGSDGQSELLIALARAGFIRRFDVRDGPTPPQIPAYGLMFEAAVKANVPFIGFLDADEFFEPLDDCNAGAGAALIRSAFASSGAAALSYNWMCLGSSATTADISLPVLERFDRAAAIDFIKNKHFKTFLDVEKSRSLIAPQPFSNLMNPHGLRLEGDSYIHDGAPMIAGTQFGQTEDASWETARIRHYCVKSREEFAEGKQARGRPDVLNSGYDDAFFRQHDRNDVASPLSAEALQDLREEIGKIEGAIARSSSDEPPRSGSKAAVSKFADRLRRLALRNQAELLESYVPELVAELRHFRRLARMKQLRVKELKQTPSYRLAAPLRLIERFIASSRKRSFKANFVRLRARLKASDSEPPSYPIARRRPRSQTFVERDRAYAEWIERHDTLRPLERQEIAHQISLMPNKPRVAIIIAGDGDLQSSIDSIDRQLYDHLQILICRERDATQPSTRFTCIFHSMNAADNGTFPFERLPLQETDLVVCIEAGDLLSETSVYLAAREFVASPDIDAIYFDHDEMSSDQIRRQNPFFKPDWNPELARHNDHFPGRATFFATKFAAQPSAKAETNCWRSHLALGAARLRHLPFIGLHQKYARPEQRTVRIGALCELSSDHAPHVTIIVATRDKVDLLRRCMSGLLHRTTYSNLNVMVVNNQSTEPQTLEYFSQLRKDSRVQIVSYDAPFNYSALHNMAVARAEGELIALVNNDIDVIEPGWLDAMVRYATQKDVGAVGAKLLYADGTVQHAGVIVGIGGGADHIFRGHSGTDPGPWNLIDSPQEFSAVTAACMVFRRSLYEQVGGLDEAMKLEFQDVDFCLKLREAGYRNIYLPHALLYHLEMQSRGTKKTDGSDLARFRDRWPQIIANDPCYNPNLSLGSLERDIASQPRVAPPWRR